MFFEAKSEKTRQNKYLPWFCKLFSLKFPQLHNCGTWSVNTAKKASLARVFLPLWVTIFSSKNSVTACCWFPGIKAALDYFLTKWISGKQLSKYKKCRARDGQTRSWFLRIYNVFKISDISLCYVYPKFLRSHHGQKSNNTIWKFRRSYYTKTSTLKKYDVIHHP